MAKTQAEIAAEQEYPTPQRSDFHTDTEYEVSLVHGDYKQLQSAFELGYNAAPKGYSETDMLKCWQAALGHSFDYTFKDWLAQYKPKE